MKVIEGENGRINKRTLWITWGLFTIMAIYIACNHEPWYDEYHVWVMCKHLRITWLWFHMMKEGHFILWHLLIYPFVQLGCSFWCLQFVGVSLVSAAVWVILMKSPFDYISKCLVVFSYPILYVFPIIARCYALVPILLFITAWLYTIQKKHLFLYCFFVGLIAHTHAYMEGFVGSLFLLFCYEQIYLSYRKKESIKKPLIGAFIIISVVLFAYIQVIGSLQYANTNLPEKTNNLYEVIESFFYFTTSNELFIIPGDWHLIFPKSILDNPYYSLLYIVLWFFILYNLVLIFWKHFENRKYIFVCLGAIGWQIWMALFVYGFGHQRLFLPIIIIIFALWVSYRFDCYKNYLVIFSCIFILTAGHYNIYRDIKGIFCEDTPLLDYVKKNIRPSEKLYFTSYFIGGAVEQLYYNYDKHLMNSSMNPVTSSSPKRMTDSFIGQAFKECEAKNTIYMFTDKTYENYIGSYKLSLLTNVGRYYIYKIDDISQLK